MNTWTTPSSNGDALADPYTRHSHTLRGALRHALVDRALAEHLTTAPQSILDIGGGTGVHAQTLARSGHHVTLLDPDTHMLHKARAAWEQDTKTAPGTVTFVNGTGEQAPQLTGEGWDAVLCHGVLMYLDDPAPLLRALARCVKPGGMVSILAKQTHAMAMRPGLERDWAGVLEALRSPAEQGRLGVTSRGVDREDVCRILAEHRVHTSRWYGLRCLTDHLGDEPVDDDFPAALEAEWEVGRRDPYRHIARMFHLIAHRAEREQEAQR